MKTKSNDIANVFCVGRPAFAKTKVTPLAAFALILLGYFAGLIASADAQSTQKTASRPAQVTANASKSMVRVAEPFQLELQVTAPSNAKVFFPAVSEQLGAFDVADHQDILDVPVADSNALRSWTRRMTLESINTGELEIPSIEIQVRNDSTADSIKSAAIPVRVVSVLEGRADPTQFRDIRSVVDVAVPPSTSHAWVWWVVGGSGTATLALAYFVLFAKRKKHLTPALWARAKLDDLLHSVDTRCGDTEPVLREMSTILREYLQLQFEISAPVQTTQQFLQLVEKGRFLDSDAATKFGKLLMEADQAKFAGLQLTPQKLEEAIETACAVVDATANHTAQVQPEAIQNTVSNQSNFAETR